MQFGVQGSVGFVVAVNVDGYFPLRIRQALVVADIEVEPGVFAVRALNEAGGITVCQCTDTNNLTSGDWFRYRDDASGERIRGTARVPSADSDRDLESLRVLGADVELDDGRCGAIGPVRLIDQPDREVLGATDRSENRSVKRIEGHPGGADVSPRLIIILDDDGHRHSGCAAVLAGRPGKQITGVVAGCVI